MLLLTGCEKLEKTRKETAMLQEKLQQLQQEVFHMDTSMAQYRQSIPAYAGEGEAGAKRYAVELARELAALEQEIVATDKAIEDAQAALETAKANLQALKARDPRQIK
ncbi:MAG: hypothetical protein LDL31_03985 [Prosthecobacter sp.]|nr:hypothetical protein [Prosthecobacter sp.]